MPGRGWDGRCPSAPPAAAGVRGAGPSGRPAGAWPPLRLKLFSLIGVENRDLLGKKRLTRALLKSNPSAGCAGKIALAASQHAGTWNAERETNAQSDRDVRAGDSFADNELSSCSGFLSGAFAFGDKQADFRLGWQESFRCALRIWTGFPILLLPLRWLSGGRNGRFVQAMTYLSPLPSPPRAEAHSLHVSLRGSLD